MARRKFTSSLPAPYLKRVTVIADKYDPGQGYPFDLPWRDTDIALDFTTPVTVLVGENGTGKSTLIEALAAMAGYDEAGGGKGFAPVDLSRAIDCWRSPGSAFQRPTTATPAISGSTAASRPIPRRSSPRRCAASGEAGPRSPLHRA